VVFVHGLDGQTLQGIGTQFMLDCDNTSNRSSEKENARQTHFRILLINNHRSEEHFKLN